MEQKAEKLLDQVTPNVVKEVLGTKKASAKTNGKKADSATKEDKKPDTKKASKGNGKNNK